MVITRSSQFGSHEIHHQFSPLTQGLAYDDKRLQLVTNLVPHALVPPLYHIREDRNEEFLSIVNMFYFLRCILLGSSSLRRMDRRTCNSDHNCVLAR
jgi:hypothetical protein